MAVPKTGFLGLFKPLLNQFSKWGKYYNDNWDAIDANASSLSGRMDVEHKSDGAHKNITTDSLNVSGSQTLGGVARNTWPSSGSATQALTDVLANGEKGNIPAAGEFELRDNTGAKKYFGVDEATGKITAIDLDGMLGNVGRSLVDIPLNQIELLPFASDTITVGTPVDVTDHVGLLRTVTITTSANPVAALATGHFATIGGVDYNVVGVSGTNVTLEYDSDKADPVGASAIFSMWRFTGRYAGMTNFTRASRKSYVCPASGKRRVMPAGFPCFERGPDGRIGLSYHDTVTNMVPYSGDLSNAAWNKRAGATVLSVVGGAADPDGNATASTVTVGAVGSDDVWISAPGFTASTLVISNGLWIKRLSTSGTLLVQNPAGSGFGQWRIDMSLLPDAYVYLTNGHPAVTETVAWSSTASGIAGVLFAALSGSVSFVHGGSQQVEYYCATPYINVPGNVAVTRNSDGLTMPMTGNLLRPDATYQQAVSVVIDADVADSSLTGAHQHLMSSDLSHSYLMRVNSAQLFRTFVGFNIATPTVSVPDITAVNRYVFRADGQNANSAVNAIQGQSMQITVADNGGVGKLYIGAWGNSYKMNGHLYGLRISDFYLSDPELAAS